MNAKILLLAAMLTTTTCQQLKSPFSVISNPLSYFVERIVSTLTDYGSEILNSFEEEFNNFKNTFNKIYSSAAEQEKRLRIFIENQKNIFNWKSTNSSYILKQNEYADLLVDEFNNLVNGLRIKRNGSSGSKFAHDTYTTVPDNVDWRKVGALTPVRHQGQCASCYAFAAVGAIESHLFKKTGKLEYLSPQDIIDCSAGRRYKNSGCASGTIDFSFDYIKDNGIQSESSYPYEARTTRQCRHKRDTTVITIKGYTILDEGDEEALEEAVTTKGPVATGIDGSLTSFQFYGGGIYYEPLCSSSLDRLNHAVLVVGFGTESDGQKYWLIKNSYGPNWGENGFAKLARNVTNHCGIATYALYPEV